MIFPKSYRPNPANNAFKSLYNHVIFVLVATCLMACSRDIIEPNTDQMAAGPVIECILTTDSHHVVHYTRVVGISDPFNPQTNATITLSRPNQKSGIAQSLANGTYVLSDFPLNPRDTFQFQLTAPLDTVLLTDVMPSAVSFTKTDTATQAIAGIGLTQVFTVQFRDSAIDENYYRITAQQQIKNYVISADGRPIDSSTTWKTMQIDGNETPFLRNNFNNYTEQEILFSDDIFNGVLTTFKFHNLLPFNNSKISKTIAVKITLENMSLATYQFYNSRAEHLWSQKSITQLPGPVQSNIPNGYGVIGARTKTEWIIPYPY